MLDRIVTDPRSRVTGDHFPFPALGYVARRDKTYHREAAAPAWRAMCQRNGPSQEHCRGSVLGDDQNIALSLAQWPVRDGQASVFNDHGSDVDLGNHRTGNSRRRCRQATQAVPMRDT
jgi:hypothetical protein